MFSIRKTAKVLALILILAFSATTATLAIDYPCAGYIDGSGVNMRSGPDTSYGTYGQFNFGYAFQVLGLENDWYKIETHLAACGYAYVHSDYVAIGEPPASASYGGATGNVSAGQRVVQIAEQFLGLPYVYGGSTPSGFDCSGFTSYVFKQMGYTLNRVSADQLNNGVPVSKSELIPGDLVLFKKQGASRIHHVGIYVGDGMMIHSPQTGDVIKYASIVTGYYNNCYYAARRIVH